MRLALGNNSGDGGTTISCRGGGICWRYVCCQTWSTITLLPFLSATTSGLCPKRLLFASQSSPPSAQRARSFVTDVSIKPPPAMNHYMHHAWEFQGHAHSIPISVLVSDITTSVMLDWNRSGHHGHRVRFALDLPQATQSKKLTQTPRHHCLLDYHQASPPYVFVFKHERVGISRSRVRRECDVCYKSFSGFSLELSNFQFFPANLWGQIPGARLQGNWIFGELGASCLHSNYSSEPVK